MLRNGFRFFMAIIFGTQVAFAGTANNDVKQWQKFNEERINLAISTFITKYQGVKNPAQLPEQLLPSLTEKELNSITKEFKNLKQLPSLHQENHTLIFTGGSEDFTFEIVDLGQNKYKINGKNYTNDPSAPFNETVRYIQERYFKKSYSGIWTLIIPAAYANPVLIAILAALAGAAFSTLGGVSLVALCRQFGLSGGPCGGVEDPKYDNKCVSKDNKDLLYTVKKPDGSWTTLSASLKDGQITQLTQLYLKEAASAPTQNADAKKNVSAEEVQKNPDIRRVGLPIIYNFDKPTGDLVSVEIPGRTINLKNLPPEANGEPNKEAFAFEQMKGLVKAMINFCRDHKGKFGDWDDVVTPVAMSIDKYAGISGDTAQNNAMSPDKNKAPKIRTLTEVKKAAQQNGKTAH